MAENTAENNQGFGQSDQSADGNCEVRVTNQDELLSAFDQLGRQYPMSAPVDSELGQDEKNFYFEGLGKSAGYPPPSQDVSMDSTIYGEQGCHLNLSHLEQSPLCQESVPHHPGDLDCHLVDMTPSDKSDISMVSLYSSPISPMDIGYQGDNEQNYDVADFKKRYPTRRVLNFGDVTEKQQEHKMPQAAKNVSHDSGFKSQDEESLPLLYNSDLTFSPEFERQTRRRYMAAGGNTPVGKKGRKLKHKRSKRSVTTEAEPEDNSDAEEDEIESLVQLKRSLSTLNIDLPPGCKVNISMTPAETSGGQGSSTTKDENK